MDALTKSGKHQVHSQTAQPRSRVDAQQPGLGIIMFVMKVGILGDGKIFEAGMVYVTFVVI